MTEANVVARLEAVTRRYRQGAGAGFALSPTTLQLEAGTWTALAGRSGAGKTTLLQILAGLDRPDDGRVWLFGRAITRQLEGALPEIRRRRLGIVHQDFRFIRHLRVWQNVSCRFVPDGVPARERRRRAAEALAELDLEAVVDRLPRRLSGGEQQRVALARAIVHGPEILVADEPTSNVDAVTGERIVRCLAALKSRGTTVIVSTHDPLLLEPADRVLQMTEGRIAG